MRRENRICKRTRKEVKRYARILSGTLSTSEMNGAGLSHADLGYYAVKKHVLGVAEHATRSDWQPFHPPNLRHKSHNQRQAKSGWHKTRMATRFHHRTNKCRRRFRSNQHSMQWPWCPLHSSTMLTFGRNLRCKTYQDHQRTEAYTTKITTRRRCCSGRLAVSCSLSCCIRPPYAV